MFYGVKNTVKSQLCNSIPTLLRQVTYYLNTGSWNHH